MPRRPDDFPPVEVEENPLVAAAAYETGIDPARLLHELEAMVTEQLGGDAA